MMLIWSCCYRIEYSSNYSVTSSLWFYCKDEATNFDIYTANTNNPFKSFKYKAKLLVVVRNCSILKNATIALPLKYPKYLSDF